mgnify:CR=1 FL=1
MFMFTVDLPNTFLRHYYSHELTANTVKLVLLEAQKIYRIRADKLTVKFRVSQINKIAYLMYSLTFKTYRLAVVSS